MPKKTVSELQDEVNRLRDELNARCEENTRLYKELKKVVNPEPKPWYMSIGVWLAILLTLIVLYLVYVFYMAETGHNVILPDFLK